MKGVYRIHEGNWERFQERIEQINKKAEKLGCPPVSYQVVGYETRRVPEPVTGPTLFEKYVVVELEGETPKLQGWRFVAVLQHEPAGNIVRALPGEEVPEEYRTAPRKCDHCGLIRQRKDTYVVRNEQGEYRQVGSSCLRDFLGGDDPHQVAKWLQELHGFFAECESWGEPGEANWWSIREYLGLVLAVIRQEGWISKARAEETGRTSTAEEAANLYWNTMRRYEKERALESLSDKDWELIDRALAWVRELTPATDYQHNLKVACAEDVMNPRNAGLVASLLVAYEPDLSGRKKGPGRVVGQIGERIEVTVRVVRKLYLDGDWGGTTMHVFEDEEGNELVWYASTADLDEGEWYRIRGTVKRYAEYRGRVRTVLTRCTGEKLERIEEAAQVPSA